MFSGHLIATNHPGQAWQSTLRERGQGSVEVVAARRAHSLAASAAKFKAIWEPVNYTEDVPLTGVFFANANVGWVSGGATGGGIISFVMGFLGAGLILLPDGRELGFSVRALIFIAFPLVAAPMLIKMQGDDYKETRERLRRKASHAKEHRRANL